jgi:hypothetical protein
MMYRGFMCVVDNTYDQVRLEQIATQAKVKLVWAKTYYAHGYGREETCATCESGYSIDGRIHYVPRSEPAIDLEGFRMVALTDDHEWVLYIPGRFEPRVWATLDPEGDNDEDQGYYARKRG